MRPVHEINNGTKQQKYSNITMNVAAEAQQNTETKHALGGM